MTVILRKYPKGEYHELSLEINGICDFSDVYMGFNRSNIHTSYYLARRFYHTSCSLLFVSCEEDSQYLHNKENLTMRIILPALIKYNISWYDKDTRTGHSLTTESRESVCSLYLLLAENSPKIFFYNYETDVQGELSLDEILSTRSLEKRRKKGN